MASSEEKHNITQVLRFLNVEVIARLESRQPVSKPLSNRVAAAEGSAFKESVIVRKQLDILREWLIARGKSSSFVAANKSRTTSTFSSDIAYAVSRYVQRVGGFGTATAPLKCRLLPGSEEEAAERLDAYFAAQLEQAAAQTRRATGELTGEQLASRD